MDQNSFRDILKRYLRGQATAEEKRIIDAWYLDIEKGSPSISEEDDEEELEEFYMSSMASHARGQKHLMSRFSVVSRATLAIAASLVLGIVAFLYVFQKPPVATTEVLAVSRVDTIQWQEIFNTGNSEKRVILPDSSKVILQPRSKLKYSSAYGKCERAVCLEGEAFFDVSRNEEVPFFVHVNRLTTKVLGTSFTIKAFRQENDVTVEVKTGKVSVYTNKNRKREPTADAIILTPNQKIVYDKTVDKLSRMIVDAPHAIIPVEEFKRMRFEEAPVKEIFSAIEEVYGVNIEYDEAIFSGCALTTAISDEDIYNRLDIICKVLGASYEVKEDHIVINGSGCKNQ